MILLEEVKLENGIKARIESEIDVKAYIQNLQFSLNNGAKIEFQGKRFVDEDRDERYTNQYNEHESYKK